MNKKGLGKKYLLDILVFVLITIVLVGATYTIWNNLQTPTKVELLRNKVELASKVKDFTFGSSILPQEYFSCGTERLYWTERNRKEVADLMNKHSQATWYAYGEGKIDFIGDWADDYFTLVENPACYVCYVARNGNELGPSPEWKRYLIDESVYTDSNFNPIYDLNDNTLFQIDSNSFEPGNLKIGPNDPVFIGYSIWKTISFDERDSRFLWALKAPFKKEGFLGVAFVLDSQELNEFCKKEIFIDV